MNNFKEHLSILQTIHPSLVGSCLELLSAVDCYPTFGQLDQRLAIANLFVQVLNGDDKEQWSVRKE